MADEARDVIARALCASVWRRISPLERLAGTPEEKAYVDKWWTDHLPEADALIAALSEAGRVVVEKKLLNALDGMLNYMEHTINPVPLSLVDMRRNLRAMLATAGEMN